MQFLSFFIIFFFKFFFDKTNTEPCITFFKLLNFRCTFYMIKQFANVGDIDSF